MVHRTEALLRRGFALLLFTGVTQASNSVPGTWWMCDGYLLSEAKNQKANRQASAERAKQSLPPHTALQLETWHFLCDTATITQVMEIIVTKALTTSQSLENVASFVM